MFIKKQYSPGEAQSGELTASPQNTVASAAPEASATPVGPSLLELEIEALKKENEALKAKGAKPKASDDSEALKAELAKAKRELEEATLLNDELQANLNASQIEATVGAPVHMIDGKTYIQHAPVVMFETVEYTAESLKSNPDVLRKLIETNPGIFSLV